MRPSVRAAVGAMSRSSDWSQRRLLERHKISATVREYLAAALLAHELVKVKVHDADEAEACAEALHEGTKGQLVQHIGKTLLFYKAHPQKPEIVLPKSKP